MTIHSASPGISAAHEPARSVARTSLEPEDPAVPRGFSDRDHGRFPGGDPKERQRLFADFEQLAQRVPQVLERHRCEARQLEQQFCVDGKAPIAGSPQAREYRQARTDLLHAQGQEMLVLQSEMQRAHFGVEMVAKVVEQATGSVRTLSQTQL